MEQVQDKSGQVARLDVKSKSSYEQKEWLPPEAMVAEECLVRVEVERLNNLPMELEEIDKPPEKRTIRDKTVRKVLVPGRGRSKKKRLEGSMVVRSLDNFVVRVLSPAKRDREELVGTEDAVAKWAKLE